MTPRNDTRVSTWAVIAGKSFKGNEKKALLAYIYGPPFFIVALILLAVLGRKQTTYYTQPI